MFIILKNRLQLLNIAVPKITEKIQFTIENINYSGPIAQLVRAPDS